MLVGGLDTSLMIGRYDSAVPEDDSKAAVRVVRLLVSVVSADEVEAALAGGADIVDVKNPAEGSLGAPAPALLRAVRSRVTSPVEVSAALGDAPHLPGTMALAAAGAAACGADYLKIGLFGSARPEQALDLLSAVRRAAAEVNPRARLMAAAYADASRVGALPPGELPSLARKAGFDGVMLDTAVKDGVSTFAALGEDGVAAFCAAARALGLLSAVAGALGPADVERCWRLGADIVGVRGSACEGGRQGTVSAARVRALRAALAQHAGVSLAFDHP
jgi:(5-formylfuran-3-yl)methyl phosphate synthase